MARTSRLRAALFLWVVLQLSGQIHATESGSAEAPPPPPQTIQPTRESIYQHLTKELHAALGAEQHIKEAFARVAEGMRASVRDVVIPGLQALVDGVLQATEDAWVAADDAGRSVAVKPCVDGAENDAQQVAKRALEKVEGCIQAVEEEGQRRVREASRLLNDIEDVSKRFVTTLETCIKEEEAKEAAQPPADTSADPDPATPETDGAVAEAPGNCPKVPAGASGQEADAAAAAGEKPTRCPNAKDPKVEEPTAAEEGGVEIDAGAKQKCKGLCSKRKKSPEGEVPKAETSEEDVSQADTKKSDEIENVNTQEKAGKLGKEHKGKKGKDGKDNKRKDKSGKWKDENSANTDETVEEKGAEKSEDTGKGKGKHKKAKDVDVVDKTGKGGEREGKKSKTADSTENSNTEQNSGEVKDKKSKKSDKKEGKGKKDKGEESGEGKKSRKKRDLLALNEVPEAAAQPQASVASKSAAAAGPQEAEAPSPARDPWPTEGSTPEERRMITCLRSPTIKPLLDEKTRAYQRLQAVLQRTAAKQQDAPTCVTDHVRKAELKISALKQRLAACADRKMRQEL